VVYGTATDTVDIIKIEKEGKHSKILEKYHTHQINDSASNKNEYQESSWG
jgi:hypothetical protein